MNLLQEGLKDKLYHKRTVKRSKINLNLLKKNQKQTEVICELKVQSWHTNPIFRNNSSAIQKRTNRILTMKR